MIDERIAERRRDVRNQERRRRLRRTILVAAAVVVIVALVLVERSALVALEEVQVTGLERLEPEDVVEAAALPLGTSTLRLRLRAAEQRVADLPLVASVSARRVDPLTVRIEVVERVPVLTVAGRDGEVLVDRDGMVMVEGGLPSLPVIEIPGRAPATGEHVEEHPALDNAHRAWRGLSGPLRAEVVRYVAESADELRLELRSGVWVNLGRAERLDEKVRALGAVLADVGDTPVREIDVRAPSAPVLIRPS